MWAAVAAGEHALLRTAPQPRHFGRAAGQQPNSISKSRQQHLLHAGGPPADEAAHEHNTVSSSSRKVGILFAPAQGAPPPPAPQVHSTTGAQPAAAPAHRQKKENLLKDQHQHLRRYSSSSSTSPRYSITNCPAFRSCPANRPKPLAPARFCGVEKGGGVRNRMGGEAARQPQQRVWERRQGRASQPAAAAAAGAHVTAGRLHGAARHGGAAAGMH